jgi:lipopolysaccharide export system protein LptA
LALASSGIAWAEKADRQQPLSIEADRSSTVDLARKVVVFNGRVVLTQGTLRITADRMEVTDLGQGQRTAVAVGTAEQVAEFREKRDGLDEFVEGRAQTIEYDSRDERIRLQGKAFVRRLRGTQVADELQGDTIVWNGAKEFFSVAPASPAASGAAAPADGSGRVRAVFSPPPPAASEPQSRKP